MRIALAVLVLVASPLAAADPGEDAVAPMAQMMREVWASQKVATMSTVQQVFGRTIGFELPRAFVPAYRAQNAGRYMMEYVPDGETVQAWTRMITVSGSLGGGAARLDDETLANAVFDRAACADWIYRDLGATDRPPLGYRTLVIGCGSEGAPGSERGVIAFFRDDQTVWTVQYAARGAASNGFEATAKSQIARLDPLLTCKTGDAKCAGSK